MDKRLAMLAPSEAFATPEQVRDSTELTTGERVEILKRWAYDVAEAAVALEEGMPEGGPDDLQRRILLALAALADDVDRDFERTGPTKQHGLPVSRKR
ncbi:MAG TPA: hypothetical protein VIC71_05650 [Gammaproteobacteria bacterium]|jgi:hypothetical protein